MWKNCRMGRFSAFKDSLEIDILAITCASMQRWWADCFVICSTTTYGISEVLCGLKCR